MTRWRQQSCGRCCDHDCGGACGGGAYFRWVCAPRRRCRHCRCGCGHHRSFRSFVFFHGYDCWCYFLFRFPSAYLERYSGSLVRAQGRRNPWAQSSPWASDRIAPSSRSSSSRSLAPHSHLCLHLRSRAHSPHLHHECLRLHNIVIRVTSASMVIVVRVVVWLLLLLRGWRRRVRVSKVQVFRGWRLMYKVRGVGWFVC